MKRTPLLLRLAFCALALLLLTACAQAAFLHGGGPIAAGGPEEELAVHFIDVGQADCALLLCGGASMLIDGGNVEDSSLVVSYLKEQDVSQLDYVVSTHAHEDHVGGLSGALNVCKADVVYSPVTEYDSKAFRDFKKYTEAQGLSLTKPTPGETFHLGDALVEILGPLKDYGEDTNNSSIVLKVTYGETSFLFTGDAERGAEADLLDAGYDLRATVLKVGHHGSDSSSSYPFLREVMPTYGVISVGTDNSYGHPTDGALSRLRDAGVTLYRTDMQGHIIATSDGKTVTFETKRAAATPTNPTAQESNEADSYIGNVKSLKLHVPSCPNLPSESNRVYFDSYHAAIEEGYTPCGTCLN